MNGRSTSATQRRKSPPGHGATDTKTETRGKRGSQKQRTTARPWKVVSAFRQRRRRRLCSCLIRALTRDGRRAVIGRRGGGQSAAGTSTPPGSRTAVTTADRSGEIGPTVSGLSPGLASGQAKPAARWDISPLRPVVTRLTAFRYPQWPFACSPE